MNENLTVDSSHSITTTGLTPHTYECVERQLWATVLLTMVHDLCSSNSMDWDKQREAERWVGSFPSRDFKIVVSLAGLDPDSVWERLSAICATPARKRKYITAPYCAYEKLRGAA